MKQDPRYEKPSVYSARIQKMHHDYIKENHKELNDPDTILRVVRYILRTPEGQNVIIQAEKIMQRLNKQKAEFLAKKKSIRLSNFSDKN